MIEEKIQGFFKETIIKLIDSYEQKGLRASGRYANDLKSTITSSGSKINAKITGPIESYFMEHGRGPNRNPSLGSVRFLGKILEKWVSDKGIDVNPYAAAHKIVYQGILVPNPYNPGGVITDVINDNWFDELYNLLRLDLITSIRSDVIKNIKQK